MVIEIFQLVITVISIMLFLRVYWIQAASNSLVSMMKMKKKEVLNEIEIESTHKELDHETIIEALSYLNLVSKLYLNNCINTNMLRTFEGVMIKLLNNKKAQKIYEEIYYEFRDTIKTAEPPYINLIYATNLLVSVNKKLNNRNFVSPLFSWFYLIYKKLFFNIRPSSDKNWKLALAIFESNNDVKAS